jgi:hypothetical protein
MLRKAAIALPKIAKAVKNVFRCPDMEFTLTH